MVEEKKLSEAAETVEKNKNVVVFFCEYKPTNPVLIMNPCTNLSSTNLSQDMKRSIPAPSERNFAERIFSK